MFDLAADELHGGENKKPDHLSPKAKIKEELTFKSWFRMSGPTNWEASLPIYKWSTKEQICQPNKLGNIIKGFP